MVESLPADVFTARDSLGWTYQFWQAERKDAVNKSGVKIGADELPAVTQLFTERYMVLFLLHNTIGAWRAGRLLEARSELAATAASEEELRDAVRLRSARQLRLLVPAIRAGAAGRRRSRATDGAVAASRGQLRGLAARGGRPARPRSVLRQRSLPDREPRPAGPPAHGGGTARTGRRDRRRAAG